MIDSNDPTDAHPCPDCGNQYLTQITRQSETVEVTSDGHVEAVDPHDHFEIIEVFCPECDEVLWREDD
jgi:predicted RNA-binding Zn-ribbon protein involved in translation (DUF1610 family)